MTTLFSLISNSPVLKYLFGYSFGLSSLAIIEQQFTQADYFQNLLNQVPSQIAVVLGVIYGIVVLLGRISKEWKQHMLNVQEVTKGKELIEQEELRTEKQRKELNEVIVEFEDLKPDESNT